MKIIILLITIFFSSIAYSQDQDAKIIFQKGNSQKTFQIQVTGQKGILKFHENKAKPKTVKISTVLASSLISEARGISWKAEYRKPASARSCDVYAKMTFFKEKPISVCHQDLEAKGRTFGLLNRLHSLSE